MDFYGTAFYRGLTFFLLGLCLCAKSYLFVQLWRSANLQPRGAKMIYPTSVFSLIAGPVRAEQSLDGTRTVLTHLQKFSKWGFMLHWPFGFHFWFWFRKQQQDAQGGWLPGTERGIYFRTPGYRWDLDLGMIWTWGYFGFHWD